MRDLEIACRNAAGRGLLHGAVIAAGNDESLGLLWAWGKASVEPRQQNMRTDAVFDLASVTKVVATATACAICADRGLLDIRAPVSHYLPNAVNQQGGDIRVCDLASHFSGLDNRKFHLFGAHSLLLKAIESPAQFPPRRHHIYSCRNFIILGEIVKKITGDNLAVFCEANLFRPLAMRNTAFGPLKGDLSKVVPSSTEAGVISDEQARMAPVPLGNAGVFSSAPDLAKFAAMMLRHGEHKDGRIFQRAGFEILTQPCSPEGLPTRSFGWDMRSINECPHRPSAMSPRAIGHSGWTGQSLWLDMKRGCYVIVLTNRTHAMPPGGADTHLASARFRAHVADIALGIAGLV